MNATVINVVVARKSQYGVLSASENKWINTSDKGLLESLVAGHAYDLELGPVKGADGKTRNEITKVINDKGPSADAPVVAKAPYVKKAFVKRSVGPARDFTAEAKGKSIHGLICAALQSPRTQNFNTEAQVFQFIDSVVDYGMKKIFSNEK